MLHNTYGFARAIPENVDETREVEFIISSAAKDRHSSVVNMDGWSLENYNRNPIVGYQHNLYGNLFGMHDPDDVIGTGRVWMDTDNTGNKVLKGAIKFETEDVNPKAEKLFRKVKAGSLRATSVGFMELGQGEWKKERNMKGEEEQTYYFKGQELLEFSLVNIPSNPEAVKRTLGDSKDQLLTFIQKFLPEEVSIKQLRQLKVQDVLDMIEGKYKESEEHKSNSLSKIRMRLKLMEHELKLN